MDTSIKIRESHGGGRVTPVELKPPPSYEDMEDEVWTLAQRCYRRKVLCSVLATVTAQVPISWYWYQ